MHHMNTCLLSITVKDCNHRQAQQLGTPPRAHVAGSATRQPLCMCRRLARMCGHALRHARLSIEKTLKHTQQPACFRQYNLNKPMSIMGQTCAVSPNTLAARGIRAGAHPRSHLPTLDNAIRSKPTRSSRKRPHRTKNKLLLSWWL